MTTAVLAFVRGKIGDSFLIQPAAALLSFALVICGFLAFLVAGFGVYFSFLKRLFEEIKLRHIVLAVIVIIVAGWAVTLSRLMAMNK